MKFLSNVEIDGTLTVGGTNIKNQLTTLQTNINTVSNTVNTVSANANKIKTYVGSDGKLHFTNASGADTALNFSKGNTDLEYITSILQKGAKEDISYTPNYNGYMFIIIMIGSVGNGTKLNSFSVTGITDYEEMTQDSTYSQNASNQGLSYVITAKMKVTSGVPIIINYEGTNYLSYKSRINNIVQYFKLLY